MYCNRQKCYLAHGLNIGGHYTNVKYKARALQYLLDQRTSRLNEQWKIDLNDAWILHLDEESIITPQSINGIELTINYIRPWS